jgi:ferrous iron transport protein B
LSTWALIGSPNSGKTTLYNWLTGAGAKVVNYPGSTVEFSIGELRLQLSERHNCSELSFIDTPGIYSLEPKSEDEQVTHNVLFSQSNRAQKINAVIMVLDATQLSRHLIIAKQIQESGYPVLFVLTMRDLIEKEDGRLDLELLKLELGAPIIMFDGVLGSGLDELVNVLSNYKNIDNFTGQKVRAPKWDLIKQTEVIRWAETLAKLTFNDRNAATKLRTTTNKIDKFLMHPFLGLIFFFLLMTAVFSSIYWLAAPMMDFIDEQFSGWAVLAQESFGGLFGEFIGSGLISAIGGVIIFVPQIFILFVGLGLLEASGYLARVAVLIDKPLSWIGLGGRSFVPLMSGYACAIPAIMAARNISSKKERLIVQSIIPFMTCSARLPVYALLLSFIYGDEHPIAAGFAMAFLYFAALLVGAIASQVISVFIKDKTGSRLMMELPLYRRPRVMLVLMQSFSKAKAFVLRAGPIILILSLVLWFGTNFPRHETESGQSLTASQVAQESYAAQVGRYIEPIFKPLGVDWRVGFSLISAFAAREVFVSSLVLVFNVDAADEDAQIKNLLSVMKRASFPDGSPIFTTATVVGIIVFFMIALQCISTVGVMKREMGSWKPALLQLFLSNFVAYNVAVVTVFILKLVGL